jgi:hypothetical protein
MRLAVDRHSMDRMRLAALPRMLHALWRAAIVLCLALAALLLAVDAREYPGFSRPGLQALAYGALPLLLSGAINLRALSGGRGWRGAAAICNLVMLAVALRMVSRDGPPFARLLLGAAVLLVVCSAVHLVPRREAAGHPSPLQ